MYFKQVIREDLGCAAYIVGPTVEGTAVVIDPRVDMVSEVRSLLDQQGLRLTKIIETHLHADHVSGRGHLAQSADVLSYIHEAANVGYQHEDLKAGMQLSMGEVMLEVLPTPGHRPEHVSLVVTDSDRSQEPWLVLTGDALFVGDVGRPDLAVPIEEGSSWLYHSLYGGLLQLPDWVEMYPAHLAGSLCGRITSRKTSSTIGFERRSNPALAPRSETEFIRGVTAALPPQPPNMQAILERNRAAEPSQKVTPSPVGAVAMSQRLEAGAVILDVRSPTEFGTGHIPGAVNVYLDGGQFGTRVGFVIAVESELLLVLDSELDLARVREALAVVGYDVNGYLAGGMEAWRGGGADIATIPQVSPQELNAQLEADAPVTILDVREDTEWASGHIPSAVHVPFHKVENNLDQVPKGHLAVVCGSGMRSSIATSLLQRAGRTDVKNITGGMAAWRKHGYPTTTYSP